MLLTGINSNFNRNSLDSRGSLLCAKLSLGHRECTHWGCLGSSPWLVANRKWKAEGNELQLHISLLFFFAYPWRCLGVTPGSAPKNYFQRGSGDHKGVHGLNTGLTECKANSLPIVLLFLHAGAFSTLKQSIVFLRLPSQVTFRLSSFNFLSFLLTPKRHTSQWLPSAVSSGILSIICISEAPE